MKRSPEMIALWQMEMISGASMQAIAIREGISRERVRQLLNREGHHRPGSWQGGNPTDPLKLLAAIRAKGCHAMIDASRVVGCQDNTAWGLVTALGMRESVTRLFRIRRALRSRHRAESRREHFLQKMRAFVHQHGRLPKQDGSEGLYPTECSAYRLSYYDMITQLGLPHRPKGFWGHDANFQGTL